MDRALTDRERFPLLTEAGRERLRWLEEHPHAPRYNHRCGDRLDARALERVRAYGKALGERKAGWSWGEAPAWLAEWARACLAEVPFYRGYGAWGGDFAALPSIERADLLREPWSFVPDGVPLDDLILYRSSQTTGDCLTVLSHPEVSACDLPLLEQLLAAKGVSLEGASNRLAIVMVCAQTRTITYPMVVSYLGEAGFAKINLNPADWRDLEDRVRFLDDCNAEIYSGDPVAFHELVQLPLRTRPKALITTAMTLFPGFRSVLEGHFACPVFDLYAMNEAGIITADAGEGHAVLSPDLYVEILAPDGTPCPPGERGEITVSGGINPFLRLLRYRTGDWAAMNFDGPAPRLVDFEPRAPVLFRGAGGKALPAHHVTAALRDFPLAAVTLRQAADGAVEFRSCGEGIVTEEVRAALQHLFGDESSLAVEELPRPYEWGGKIVQYSCELT
jgi:hypothetical protein